MTAQAEAIVDGSQQNTQNLLGAVGPSQKTANLNSRNGRANSTMPGRPSANSTNNA